MVQQWRRSYFCFLSFAKKKGVSCAPRKSSIFARVRKVYKPLAPRPDWDNTINDLSAWRLTPKQLEARRTAFRTLPEHRVKRSVSSAAPSVSCNEQTNPHTREHTARQSATCAASSSKPSTSETLKPVPHTNLKNRNTVRRFGKENKTSAVEETLQPRSKGTHNKKLTGEGLKARSTESCRKFSNPSRTAVDLTSRIAQSYARSQILNPTIVQESESRGNQTRTVCSTPTVDFEDEVKQFEARAKKFLVQAPKPRRGESTPLAASAQASLSSSRAGRSIYNNYKNDYSKTSCFERAKRLRTLKLLSGATRRVMDKSDSSDDDSSLSGPWGNSVTRFQKVLQSVPQQHHHHHHRKQYSRKLHDEPPPTAAHLSSPKADYWDLQPQNELVHFKQPVDAAAKPRTKLVKRHFGSIQRTSPIGDWKGNLEEGAVDHLSLQEDFQQHMLKCQHDLTQEFKEFKISISKQIMNLQLDIDTVLELQKRKDSHPAETRAPSSYRTGAESPVQEGVGDNVELPTYSSMKAKKDMMNPASPSSGESSHMPLFSCYDSQYTTGSRKSTRSENGSRRQSSATAAGGPGAGEDPEPHVFNNPIYHVQTSSHGESSDTDTSISSVELAKFVSSRGGHRHQQQHLKPESHASAEDLCVLPDEQHGLSSHGTRGPSCLRMLEMEDKKDKSPMPYRLAQAPIQEAATTRLAEGLGDSLENSYRVKRLESNGQAQTSTSRPGASNEQTHESLRQSSAFRHHSQVFRPGTKNGTPPSPGIGSYRTQALVSEEEPAVQHDLELRLGHSGASSGRASPKEYRNRLSPSVSRPLFTTGTWDKASNPSIIDVNVGDVQRSDAVAKERPNSRNSKAVKSADEREVFTLRGWSAAFLQPTENIFHKGVPEAPAVVREIPSPNRATTPEPPKKECQKESSNGIIRFQGRSSKGGVAWTVSEPPGGRWVTKTMKELLCVIYEKCRVLAIPYQWFTAKFFINRELVAKET